MSIVFLMCDNRFILLYARTDSLHAYMHACVRLVIPITGIWYCCLCVKCLTAYLPVCLSLCLSVYVTVCARLCKCGRVCVSDCKFVEGVRACACAREYVV